MNQKKRMGGKEKLILRKMGHQRGERGLRKKKGTKVLKIGEGWGKRGQNIGEILSVSKLQTRRGVPSRKGRAKRMRRAPNSFPQFPRLYGQKVRSGKHLRGKPKVSERKEKREEKSEERGKVT